MSVTHSGWETRILWALETSPGTAVTPTKLWASGEKDGLSLGEEPIAPAPFTGARSSYSASTRLGIQAPGGPLGKSEMYLDGSSLDMLQFAVAHYQVSTRGTVDDTAGSQLYSVTHNRLATQPDDSALRTLTIGKDTGLGSGCAYVYSGCVVDELEFDWQRGGAITWKPTLLGMSGGTNGTASGAATPATAGFMQAPNIAVTWNGAAIYPEGFTITSSNGMTALTGPSHRGVRTFSVGNYSLNVVLKTWRDGSFYSQFITPYGAETIGTLIITATTSSGVFNCGSSYKAIWTCYLRAKEMQDLPQNAKELIETVNLEGVEDGVSTFVVHTEYGATV